jgi:SAM-dependent methyltransferase
MTEEAPRRCRVCGTTHVAVVLRRDAVPVLQNATHGSEALAARAPRGRLTLVACRGCGFVGNDDFDPGAVIYDESYENDQSLSAAFLDHMRGRAAAIMAAVPAGGAVVEVGCGQGMFLRELRQIAPGDVSLFGFDPSVRGTAPDGIHVERRFLDREVLASTGKPADAIVARHVIEHVVDPVGFLRTIRQALPDRHACRLFLETPCFDWIAGRRVLQDVFYEHPNYFTAASLTTALAIAGFRPDRIDHVFDGQYLWAEAVPSSPASFVADPQAGAAVDAALAYAEAIERDIGRWRARLAGGPKTAVWGAGAKGATFVLLVDPDRALVDSLVDINPSKQGCFAGVSAHPILSPETALSRGARRVLVMNPAYRTEIAATIAALGGDVELIDAGGAGQ